MAFLDFGQEVLGLELFSNLKRGEPRIQERKREEERDQDRKGKKERKAEESGEERRNPELHCDAECK